MALEPFEPALGVVTETDQRLSALIGSEKGGGMHGDLLSGKRWEDQRHSATQARASGS